MAAAPCVRRRRRRYNNVLPNPHALQLCSGKSRHIPLCEIMVCVMALLWWIGCATTGALRWFRAALVVPTCKRRPGLRSLRVLA